MENQINFFTIEDIYNERDKNQPVDMTKIYDPLHFWEDYGERYFKEFQRREQFQFGLSGNNPISWLTFKVKMLNCETALEAGCGFGRIAPFLIDAKSIREYHGVDFSKKILDCHNIFIGEHDKKNKMHFHKASAKHMPFENKSIDLVFSSETLQHMTRTKAEHCLREFRRIAKKYVLVIERHVYPGEHPYPHIWSNDIPKLVYDLGFSVLESKVVGNGLIGLILKV